MSYYNSSQIFDTIISSGIPIGNLTKSEKSILFLMLDNIKSLVIKFENAKKECKYQNLQSLKSEIFDRIEILKSSTEYLNLSQQFKHHINIRLEFTRDCLL